MAADFDLGAIAQLGERVAGSDEVVGSSPTGSTAIPSSDEGSTVVGSEEFHRRFGWYAQRVARGERLLVTRRGKPYVRLIPAVDQLALPPASNDNGWPRGEAPQV